MFLGGESKGPCAAAAAAGFRRHGVFLGGPLATSQCFDDLSDGNPGALLSRSKCSWVGGSTARCQTRICRLLRGAV